MKVLHDYDSGGLGGYYALRRGIKLLIYALKRWLGVADPGFETDRYLETMLKLDALCGVDSVVGLRDTVIFMNNHLPAMVMGYGAELHNHWHIGEVNDPDRKRFWNPPLNQPNKTWQYEVDWINGKALRLEPGELPIWHADYPYRFSDYVDFLYAWRFGGFDPYAQSDNS
jgi:hypothetical protein